MPVIRGLEQLFADIDRRERPDARSRNRIVSKFASVADAVGFSDTLIATSVTPPYHWHDPAGTTSLSLIWALSEWM